MSAAQLTTAKKTDFRRPPIFLSPETGRTWSETVGLIPGSNPDFDSRVLAVFSLQVARLNRLRETSRRPRLRAKFRKNLERAIDAWQREVFYTARELGLPPAARLSIVRRTYRKRPRSI